MLENNIERKLSKTTSKYKASLLSFPNVVGIGYGIKVSEDKVTNEPCITLYVNQKVNPDNLNEDSVIPRKIEDIPTDVIVANFVPYSQDRHRPLKPGSSIGHYNITAGTFGLKCKDRETGADCVLSNNHVLADSNNGLIGDPILQPGNADGGEFLDDAIGQLWRYVPLKFTYSYGSLSGTREVSMGTNIVDCAIAKPFDNINLESDIIGIGTPQGVRRPTVGMQVQKSGRTTGHTTNGVIINTEAEVPVGFGPEGIVQYKHQIVIHGTGFSAGGDSGSGILDDQKFGVCLLHAGSEDITIGCNLQTVLDYMNVDLVTN